MPRAAPTTTGLLIIAHAPLASALMQCVLHVFPDAQQFIGVVDVPSNAAVDEVLTQARQELQRLPQPQVLVLADVFGATPCNIAQKLIADPRCQLVTGVNLPMLLRACTYRNEGLDALVGRALAGASQGVMQVVGTAPQTRSQTRHDPDTHHHTQ
ncbi:MAG: PTS fructose transporter subunit IIA [Rhodoferax sp.]